jgi:hypothetical protein
LWTWRQLLHLNYPARFALGSAGRYGEGHAWVTFQRDGKTYLLEPLSWPAGFKLPRLSIIRYKPKFSISWDGAKVSYFEHEDMTIRLVPKSDCPTCWGVGLLLGHFLAEGRIIADSTRNQKTCAINALFRTRPYSRKSHYKKRNLLGLGKQIFDTPETSRRNLEEAKANWRTSLPWRSLQGTRFD